MSEGLLDPETMIFPVELLDHEQVEWQRVRRTRYLIHQHLSYEYPGPIYDLNQRLMVLPPKQHGDQHLVDYHLSVSSTNYEISCCDDDFGNRVIDLVIPSVERTIAFDANILVERNAKNDRPYYVSADWLMDPRLLEPSALTQPDEALERMAATLRADGAQGLLLAQRINEWTYRALNYAHDVTDIHTTAAQALALGCGVCQDYAHIMLTLCRLCDLPARYVSGHMLGEGGTHAWVEVLLPVAEEPDVALVVPFDPTHGRQARLDYLTIAVGRDYYEVA
ncbi:MAG: transglutaminase family protein, partial [Ktedonobacteraceae bacterium]|nr:transglutaminase family protein [Ktedonobacteraceae bacterium]